MGLRSRGLFLFDARACQAVQAAAAAGGPFWLSEQAHAHSIFSSAQPLIGVPRTYLLPRTGHAHAAPRARGRAQVQTPPGRIPCMPRTSHARENLSRNPTETFSSSSLVRTSLLWRNRSHQKLRSPPPSPDDLVIVRAPPSASFVPFGSLLRIASL